MKQTARLRRLFFTGKRTVQERGTVHDAAQKLIVPDIYRRQELYPGETKLNPGRHRCRVLISQLRGSPYLNRPRYNQSFERKSSEPVGASQSTVLLCRLRGIIKAFDVCFVLNRYL